MKRKIAIGFRVFVIAVTMSACSSTPPTGSVFSVQMEPGFDGYYVQTSENKFLPLEKVIRTGFKENVSHKKNQYNFCETYQASEFLKMTKIASSDFRINAVKGDSGRPEGDAYRLYKITNINDSKTDPKVITLCGQKIESKLAKHGATAKIKPKSSLQVGIYYLKDEKWFINDKSRLFEIFTP